MKHRGPVSGVATSKNKYVATAGYDNKVILWDALTNKPLAIGTHDHLANQCQFSHCGKFLVSSSSDHTARLWSLPHMKLISVLADHTDDVECATIHPKLQLIATGSRDGQARLFDFSGKLIARFSGHKADVISLNWLSNTNDLVTTSDDGTIRRWSIFNNKKHSKLFDSNIQTDALVVASNGTIYAGNDKGEILVISENETHTITAHAVGIKKLILNHSGNQLLSLGYDKKAILWTIKSSKSPEMSHVIDLPYFVWARSAAFLNKNRLVFATFGSSYCEYDISEKKWFTNNIVLNNCLNAVCITDADIWTIGDSGILKKNGRNFQQLPSLCNFLIEFNGSIITGGQSGDIFNATTNKIIHSNASPLNCAEVFVKNGVRHLIIGTYTGEALIFSEKENTIIYQSTIKLHDNAIKGISATNGILFSVCATGAAAWHSTHDYQVINNLADAHHKIANGCDHLAETAFISVSRDRVLRFWEIGSSKLIASINTPHTHSIKCISSTPAGTYIATGSYNGRVSIYDTKNKLWNSIRPTQSGISCLKFSKVLNKFIASSYDGRLYAINLKSDDYMVVLNHD